MRTLPDRFHRPALAACLAVAATLSAATAGASDGNCILAGRLDDSGRWAPRFAGVQLQTERGARVTAPNRAALATVKQATVSGRALLSACSGDQPIRALGDTALTPTDPVPALAGGTAPIAVEAVAFTRLRTGGALVELRVNPPADRVVMVNP